MARCAPGRRQEQGDVDAAASLVLPWLDLHGDRAWPLFPGVIIGVADSGVEPALLDVDLRGFARFHPDTGDVLGGTPRDHSPRRHGTRACRVAADRREGACPGAPLLVAAVLTQAQGDEMLGTEAQVLAGLDWLAEQGARIIVLPFGASQPSAAWHDKVGSLSASGVLVVAAMGNRRAAPLYPALHPTVLGVGALAVGGGAAHYSASGVPRDGQGAPLQGTKPDLLLPVPDAADQGTSFAAARAAGLIARLGPLPAGPVDLHGILASLRSHQARAAGAPHPLHDERANPPTLGEDMNDKVIARSAEVRPDDCGFRIDDKNGNLLGVLLNTENGSVWKMDANNPWPAGETLTLTVIPDEQSIVLPAQVTVYGGAEAFANSLTSGAPAPAGAKDARYLVKNGSVVLAFIAVDRDGANPTARLAAEYGHPENDDRLPLEDGKRYFPTTTLTMEAMGSTFIPSWSDHRASV